MAQETQSNRVSTTLDDDVADYIDSVSGDGGDFKSKSKAVNRLTRIGMHHREEVYDQLTGRLMYATLGSAVAFLLLFGTAVVLDWPMAAPMAAAAVTFLLGTAYASRVHTVLHTFNGGL